MWYYINNPNRVRTYKDVQGYLEKYAKVERKMIHKQERRSKEQTLDKTDESSDAVNTEQAHEKHHHRHHRPPPMHRGELEDWMDKKVQEAWHRGAISAIATPIDESLAPVVVPKLPRKRYLWDKYDKERELMKKKTWTRQPIPNFVEPFYGSSA